ncbi:SDR family oxidoreductase [Lacimicrobium alkaliphilum]|uniref:Short chain dehydrogenase n=1 Tax=Lacimicrobium alkaliphilum TaxID=1526571 RepID=A0ABQ1RA92_9ALTE|nr:SDR family oxidoreductase [Lacimicrobium alkaliphilum]GGD60094.1 short chain dehydrogenase [Lacimicrobium alkaliphilum]
MQDKKRLVITGGGSGLGRALALRWAQQGAAICVTDKDAESAARVAEEVVQAGGESFCVQADVTSEADWLTVLEQVQQHWDGADLLINNAGVATAGDFETETMEQWQWILNINLLGVVRGCQTFAPLFKKQGQGQIINISSQAGITHLPSMGSYNAVKAAVIAFSETLRMELAADNIQVSVVCPSFFRTNLDQSMRTAQPHFKVKVGRYFDRATLSAEQVADYVYKSAQTDAFIVLPHKEGRKAWYMKRFLPNLRYINMMLKMTRRKKR